MTLCVLLQEGQHLLEGQNSPQNGPSDPVGPQVRQALNQLRDSLSSYKTEIRAFQNRLKKLAPTSQAYAEIADLLPILGELHALTNATSEHLDAAFPAP